MTRASRAVDAASHPDGWAGGEISFPDGPDIEAGAEVLRARLGPEPFAAVLVLGSGLAAVAEAVEDGVGVPFVHVPGLPAAGVEGHSGRWVGGRLEGRRVLVQVGRYHLYEGLPLGLVCAPVRIAAGLGAGAMLVTNAAGGVRRFGPGDLVLLDDHLDLMGSKLSGLRFPSGWAARIAPGSPYDEDLKAAAEACARELRIPLSRGIYAALRGPSYETPAEIRMLDRCGADVVGMSTVPEVTVAHALGLRCLGLSLVTNHAAGIGPTPLRHDEVMEAGARAAAPLGRLLRAIVRGLP